MEFYRVINTMRAVGLAMLKERRHTLSELRPRQILAQQSLVAVFPQPVELRENILGTDSH